MGMGTEREVQPLGGAAKRPHRAGVLLKVALLLVLGAGCLLVWLPADRRSFGVREAQARGELWDVERATIELYTRTSPSVVHITTVAWRRDFFTMNVLEIPRGTGSGFIWDKHGHVVTNLHVIEKADRIMVTLADTSTWDASVVGVTPDKDLAVLKIKAPAHQLQPLSLGTSSDLVVGQNVFAIGNPFGLDQTLTTGVISALGREIKSSTGRPIQGVVQTDAAINPGNSGGPLLDSSGNLIGVNTAIFSPSGAFAGIGFAVPVDTVRRVVPQLIAHGRVIRPGLGVMLAGERWTRKWDIEGVVIQYVPPTSAAGRAGIRGMSRDRVGNIYLGDILTAIDGQPVRTADDLYRVLDRHNVGDVVAVEVQREGRRVKMEVKLQDLE